MKSKYQHIFSPMTIRHMTVKNRIVMMPMGTNFVEQNGEMSFLHINYYEQRAKAIGLVIPELNGKLIGSAQRVPTPTGSTTILTAVVKKAGVTKEDINAAMKAAANESFGYNEDEIVSSDIVGMRYGSLFDATQTMVNQVSDDQYEVQVVSWYDNENSYTSQMVRTIKYFSELA